MPIFHKLFSQWVVSKESSIEYIVYYSYSALMRIKTHALQRVNKISLLICIFAVSSEYGLLQFRKHLAKPAVDNDMMF